MKKFRFLSKKRTVSAILLCVIVVGVICTTYFGVKSASAPNSIYTIVIDAGHGG